MPYVATKAGGSCIAFPDVCLVPSSGGPVPTPFTNVADLAEAQNTVSDVRIENADVLVETSLLPTSRGAEAGTLGGVVSGRYCGPIRFATASAKLIVKGKRAILLGAVTTHNADNAVGQLVTVAQAKTQVSS